MSNALKRFGILALVIFLVLPLTAFAQSGDSTDEPTGEAQSVSLGDEIEGELTDDQPSVDYTLTLDEETTVAITLVAELFDTYLTLQDESGDEIAFDDDSAGSLDSRISMTLDAGTYTITALSYSFRNSNSAATGEYTLFVSEVQVNRIEYGQTIDGELTSDATEVRYLFTGQAGDVIISTHVSDDYDSYLTLEQNGGQLMSNDDGAGNLDSLIGPYTLPSTGQYTLVVRSLSGSDTGSYTLTLDRVELDTIDFGDEVTGEFTENRQTLFFQFDANVGDIIDVAVDSDIDTSLTLTDPSNYSVISDEDSGSGFNPEITNVSLNSTGTFTLVVRNSTGEAGEVTITVNRAEVPSLDDGAQTLSFSSSATSRTLVFTADGESTYRLTMVITNGSQGSPSIDMTQDGMSLGYTSTSQVQRLSIDFTPSSEGEVIVRFTDYSYNNISYRVSLETVDE